MKMMKGKKLLLKKLKHIKRDRILRVNAADCRDHPPFKAGTEVSSAGSNGGLVEVEVPEVIDVAELMKDLEDDDTRESDRDAEYDHDDKENIDPDPCFVGFEKAEVLAESDEKLRQDKSRGGIGGSGSKGHVRISKAERIPTIAEEFSGVNTYEPSPKTCRVKEATVGVGNELLAFEERCPPGGSDSVILYTTSVRGIRKTSEDFHSIRFILDGFQVKYYTRDVSMHAVYKEVHKHGKLKPLFKGVPLDEAQGHCNHCMGIRFILCSKCNENGLIVCPGCS